MGLGREDTSVLDSIVLVTALTVFAVVLWASGQKPEDLSGVNPKDPNEGNGSPEC